MPADQRGVFFVSATKNGGAHYWAAHTRDCRSAIQAVRVRLGPGWQLEPLKRFHLSPAYMDALDLAPGTVRRLKYSDQGDDGCRPRAK
jgi:hypothetical protein